MTRTQVERALACIMLLSWVGPVRAGEPPRPARVGVVHLGQRAEAPVVVGLRQGLRDLGYLEGRDVVLEIRAGQGRNETALEDARDLARGGVHLFVSAGTVATKAVKEAAGELPIVFTQVGEPVAAGFVRSLARPGGNMTGFSHLLTDTTGKRLELLRELVPSARTVLVLFDPNNPTSAAAAAEARLSAEALAVRLRERHVKTREEVLTALREVDRSTTDALLTLPDSLVVNAGDQIIEVARQKRLPVMFHEETWVERGGWPRTAPASLILAGRRPGTWIKS